MKILAFGASNSANSINARLAHHAADRVAGRLGDDATVDTLHLSDFDMPVYSKERQAEGFPPPAQAFLDRIAAADGLVISFAEFNHSMTSAFRNVLDWSSRIERRVYQGKPVLALSTAPGGRGGISALEHAVAGIPRQGGEVVATFSLPRFAETFGSDGITEPDLAQGLATAVDAFADRLGRN